MGINPPRFLYRYRPISIWSLDNLRNNQIYFSSLQGLNDPNEIRDLPLIRSVPDEEAREWLRTRSEEDRRLYGRNEITYQKISETLGETIHRVCGENIQRAMAKFRETGGVACFTCSPGNYDMWREYASNHAGFCLKFRTDIDPFRNPHFKIQKVYYGDDRVELDPLRLLKLDHNLELIREMFCHKEERWRYENEWRLLHMKGETPYFYHPAAITAVYFGIETTADHQQEIRSIFDGRRAPIKFYVARQGATPTSIRFDDFT